MLTEIEAVLNSRPLTYQEEKWEEQPLLQPIDFIQNKMILDYPLKYIGREGRDRIYHTPEEARQLSTQRQAEVVLKTSIDLTEWFWKIWSKQYLTNLREQHKLRLNEKRGRRKLPRKGDIVFLWDAVQPRNTWKIARIIELNDSPQRATREVIVETPNKRQLRRPLNRVMPLEIDSADTSETSPPKITARYNFRPRRAISYSEQQEERIQQAGPVPHALTSASLLTIMLLSFIQVTTETSRNGSHHLQCIEKVVCLWQATPHPYEICEEDYCIEFESPQ